MSNDMEPTLLGKTASAKNQVVHKILLLGRSFFWQERKRIRRIDAEMCERNIIR